MGLDLDQAVDLFLSHLKVEKRLAAATVSAYASDLKFFVDFCVAKGLEEVGSVGPCT